MVCSVSSYSTSYSKSSISTTRSGTAWYISKDAFTSNARSAAKSTALAETPEKSVGTIIVFIKNINTTGRNSYRGTSLFKKGIFLFNGFNNVDYRQISMTAECICMALMKNGFHKAALFRYHQHHIVCLLCCILLDTFINILVNNKLNFRM